MNKRFFVLHLEKRDYRPVPLAEYEIQTLTEDGQAASSTYLNSAGRTLVTGKKEAVDVPGVPQPVVEAARRQPPGKGDFVDEEGRSMAPF